MQCDGVAILYNAYKHNVHTAGVLLGAIGWEYDWNIFLENNCWDSVHGDFGFLYIVLPDIGVEV